MTNKPVSKNTQEPKKPPTKSELNKKITHLYLNDKYFASINNLNGYHKLTVLYLHNNNIDKIENLKNLHNLRSLYLQRNKIKKIENLNGLVKLQRLYLGNNEIGVVENLENLRNLEELHIEKQSLTNGDKLCFDPRTMHSLGNSLEVLNICNNNISTIQTLAPLKYLRILNASNNSISDIQNIIGVLQQLVYLRDVSLSGNPVSKEYRYRETIIAKSRGVKTLDKKDVTDITRSFMKRFEVEKSNYENRDIMSLPKSITNVAKSYPLPVQKAVSNFMLKPVNTRDGTTISLSTSEAYIPWRSMPSSFTTANAKVPPLLRKQKKRTELRKMNLSTLNLL